MSRKAFYSFHYMPDCSRAAQVRNMGVLEGNSPVSDNDWETVTQGGDSAIRSWINGQLDGKSVTIVLAGAGTAGRKWIDYEIKTSWSLGKGVMGIYIHRLRNLDGYQSTRGSNPFSAFSVGQTNLASIVQCYDPPVVDSKDAYAHIKANLAIWIEEAIAIRSNY